MTEDQLNALLSGLVDAVRSSVGTQETLSQGEEPPSDDQSSQYNEFGNLIGVKDFLEQDRTKTEREFSSATFAANRVKMDEREYAYVSRLIVSQVTTGMEKKFKPIKAVDEVAARTSTEHVYNLRLRITDLRQFLTNLGLYDVFFIIQFDKDGNAIGLGRDAKDKEKPIDLLAKPASATSDDIVKSTRYYAKRAPERLLVNLNWSFQAVMNSCDETLKGVLDAKLLCYDAIDRSGPLVFHLLFHQLTSVSVESIRLLIQQLENLKVTSYDGENITAVNSDIRATQQWLDAVNKVPDDFLVIVQKILKTCTVQDFLSYLNSVESGVQISRDLLGQTTELTPEKYMELAEEKYKNLRLARKWIVEHKESSSFQASSNKSTSNKPSSAPPADGESEQRFVNGKAEFYCAHCKRWTKTHVTANHKTKEELKLLSKKEGEKTVTFEDKSKKQGGQNKQGGRRRGNGGKSNNRGSAWMVML